MWLVNDHCIVTFVVAVDADPKQPRFRRRLHLRRAKYHNFLTALQDTTFEPRVIVEDLWQELR